MLKTGAGSAFPPAALKSARVVNSMVDAAAYFQQQKRLGEGGGGAKLRQAQPVVVKVKNDTGGALRLGEVIDLNTLPLSGNPNRRYPWYSADVPNELRVSAIVLQAIPSGDFGKAQLAGVCPALVNFSSTSHKFARVSSGNDVLQSNADSGPARVVVAPGSTGEQLVWVALGSTTQQQIPELAYFRLTSAKEMSATSATAVTVDFGGVSYADNTAIIVYDAYRITTGGAGDVLGKFVAPSGAYGYGMKRATDSGATPEYDIIDLEHYAREIRGRLTSPRMGLTDSGLIVLDYIANGITPPLNGDGEILVHDDQELFPNALGEDLAIDGGAEVIATLNDRLGSAASPYYQVKMADQRCRNATARLGQTMCGETHFQVIIEGFESSDHAPFSQIPKPRPTTAYNPFRHRARNDGRRVALRWMKVTDPNSPDGGTVEGYCIVDVPKNKRKVAFDYRISADKTQFEAFRAECAVEYCEDPQWEKIADGESCGS